MKKALLFLSAVLVLAIGATAQQMPNNSFELWQKMNVQGYSFDSPRNYKFNSNLIQVIRSANPNVAKVDGDGGGFAVALNSVADPETDTIPGILFTGTVIQYIDQQPGGFKYEARPESMIGSYKLVLPEGLDTALIQVILTKYDTAKKQTVLVGSGFSLFNKQKDAFSSFEVSLGYTDEDLNGDGEADNPDTCTILMQVGSSLERNGSTFTVDRMAFIGDGIVNGVKTISPVEELMGLSHFPNPAKEAMTINYTVTGTKAVSIRIFDINGKLIQTVNEGIKTENDYTVQINTSGLANGNYTYEMNIGDHKIARKFIVAGN